MTKLGGRATGGKKLPRLGLILIAHPKDSASPAPPDEPDDDDAPSPDKPDLGTPLAPATGETGPPATSKASAGSAQFHDQRQLCANCAHFDPAGGNNLGECMLHVPEADFSISSPEASHCELWDPQDSRSAASASKIGVRTADVSGPPNPPAAA